MKLQTVTMTNFLGFIAMIVPLDSMTLIAGPNASGKSSIRDAIAFALTGDPARGVRLKKDYGRLVSDGAKKGGVLVEMANDLSVKRTLPDGKGDDRIIEGIDEHGYIRYLTDMHEFTALNESERRTMLYNLMGVSTSGKWVGEQLLKRGCDAKAINRILPLMRQGFPAAEKAAAEGATEARAAWRALTGEVYGAEKADGWEPKGLGVKVDNARIEKMEQEDEAAQAQIDQMMQDLGALSANSEKRANVAMRVVALEPIAKMYAKRKDEHEEAAGRQKEAEQAHEEANNALKKARADLEVVKSGMAPQQKTPAHWPCPQCATKLRYDKPTNSLLRFVAQEKPKEVDDTPYVEAMENASKRTQAAAGHLRVCNDALAVAAKAYRESDAAAIQLDELRGIEESDEGDDASAIAALRDRIKVAQEKRRALRDDYLQLKKQQEMAEQLKGQAEKAALFHRDVGQYLVMREALSPNGLPREILANALGPINDALKEFCTAASFGLVQIYPDMRVLYDGHDYALCSESEKWRADAVISAAIARLSKIGFVVLDRLDVLEPKARGAAMGWLYGIREEVQSIVMATLKTEPKGAEGMSVVWLGL